VSLQARITVHVDSHLYYTKRVAHEGPATRLPQSLPASSVPTWFKLSAHRTRILQSFSVVGVLLAMKGTHQRCHFKARSHHCEKRLFASLCLSVGPSLHSNGTPRFSWDGFTSNLTFEYFSKSVEKIKVD